MEKQDIINVPIKDEKKTLVRDKWKIYFSKDTERRVFFILTLIMLVWGIFSKIGLL